MYGKIKGKMLIYTNYSTIKNKGLKITRKF